MSGYWQQLLMKTSYLCKQCQNIKFIIRFWYHLFSALFRYINMAHDIDLVPSQLWFCRAICTILFTSSMCSTLFILSMTFERFYSIIKPHKAASFNTVKKAKIIIGYIMTFSIGYNFPLWFLSSQVGESRNCNAYTFAMNSIPGQIYYWSANVLNFILPFLLLLIMNTVIISTLRNRSKFFSNSTGQGQIQGQDQIEQQIQKFKTAEIQIFVMLLLVTFSYLILNSPTYLYVFLVFANVNKQTPFSQALFHLFFSVAQKALYTNYGINFFLYVMSGQKFRKDLISAVKNILRLIICRTQVNSYAPEFNTSSTAFSNWNISLKYWSDRWIPSVILINWFWGVMAKKTTLL